MIGTVVVAGCTYHIRDLHLRNGMLIIVAGGPLPDHPVMHEPATVFGEDGVGFAQAWPIDIPSKTQVPSGQNWVTIELPLQILTLEMQTEPRTEMREP